MSDTSPILIDQPADHVCRIQINRPEKLNAVNFDVREALLQALPAIVEDPDIRAIVLGGVGGNLSAGGDVPSMEGLSDEGARERLQHIHRLCRIIWNADVPIVTAAEGIAAGGAVGLALLGDHIIVGRSTKIMVPFLKLGLVPDWGMMRSLPLRVGLPQARRLILETATIEGERAVEIGLADRVLDDSAVMSAAIKQAERLSRLPRGAVAMVKARLRQQPSFEQDLVNEERDQVRGLTSEEFEEGFRAYTEKRSADFISLG